MSLQEAFRAEYEAQRVRPLFDAVILGLAPFKFGKIEMFIDYRIDTMEDYLVIMVRGFEGIFEERLEHCLLRDEGRFYSFMSKKIFQFYRYRPRVEPEDHIILGEE